MTWLMQILCWILILVGVSACNASQSAPPEPLASSVQLHQVPEPAEISRLNSYLADVTPVVEILTPKPDQILDQDKVSVRFAVAGLPIFKDPDLGMGPHLHVVLDHRPYVAHYDLEQSLEFTDLEPGSHTLRVFASRPWHEGFKNSSAYAQVTFHLHAKTPEYIPQNDLPLLTSTRPQGNYGAEPILLDGWLANAPIRESLLDDVPKDWHIRYSLNRQSEVLDQWQPVYLQGFRPGRNYLVVELVDGEGNPIRNVFNTRVHEITYTPGGKDTLSRLTRGELKAEEVVGILQPNSPAPLPEETPARSAQSTAAGQSIAGEDRVSSTPTPTSSPTPKPTPTPEPTPTSTPEPTPTPTPEPTPTPRPSRIPRVTATTFPAPSPTPIPKITPAPRQRSLESDKASELTFEFAPPGFNL
ncbi:MAG: hypothetical protein HC921_10575 [Synechococcaceae cyanobacterium SM2_3_1]|nr:hypothetical protein [Synechococcaceae cyanobacterium SM2_3_1]